MTVKVNGTCCLQGCSLFWVNPVTLNTDVALMSESRDQDEVLSEYPYLSYTFYRGQQIETPVCVMAIHDNCFLISYRLNNPLINKI